MQQVERNHEEKMDLVSLQKIQLLLKVSVVLLKVRVIDFNTFELDLNTLEL